MELISPAAVFPDRSTYDRSPSLPRRWLLEPAAQWSSALSTGRYLSACSTNSSPITVNITVTVGRDLRPVGPHPISFRGRRGFAGRCGPNSVMHVTDRREIADVNVGLRVSHSRISDLVFHLFSPQGTRLLRMENRGGPDGVDLVQALSRPMSCADFFSGFAAHTNGINAGTNLGTLNITYEFYGVPDSCTVYYDGVLIFDSGLVSGRHLLR